MDIASKLKQFYKVHHQIEELTEQKNQIKDEIEQLIVKNKLIDKKFSIGDLNITYKKNITNQNLTQQYLCECFEKFYSKKPEEAEALMNFILDNRTKKSKYCLDVKSKSKKSNQ